MCAYISAYPFNALFLCLINCGQCSLASMLHSHLFNNSNLPLHLSFSTIHFPSYSHIETYYSIHISIHLFYVVPNSEKQSCSICHICHTSLLYSPHLSSHDSLLSCQFDYTLQSINYKSRSLPSLPHFLCISY
jgi:hypothetical protein